MRGGGGGGRGGATSAGMKPWKINPQASPDITENEGGQIETLFIWHKVPEARQCVR